jgi:hypothetical protein
MANGRSFFTGLGFGFESDEKWMESKQGYSYNRCICLVVQSAFLFLFFFFFSAWCKIENVINYRSFGPAIIKGKLVITFTLHLHCRRGGVPMATDGRTSVTDLRYLLLPQFLQQQLHLFLLLQR